MDWIVVVLCVMSPVLIEIVKTVQRQTVERDDYEQRRVVALQSPYQCACGAGLRAGAIFCHECGEPRKVWEVLRGGTNHQP